MKKLLLFFALIVVSALCNEADARYNLGSRKAYNEIKSGDTIAIQGISDNANNGYRYIGAGVLQTVFTEDCVFEVEEGPVDLRTGDPTYFLRQLAQGKYLGKNGLRGSQAASNSDVRLVSTPDSAYNVAFYSAADSSAAWNGQSNFDATSVVMCYSYEDGSEPSWSYLCNWGWFAAEQIWVWGYQDTNPWDVYQVYETSDPLGDLEDLIDYYTSLNLDFTAGTDPGFYPKELADAYNTALEEANRAVISELSDEEYKQYAEKLKAAKEAVENAYIDITEGYYYIVSAYSDFMNSQKVEMGCFMNDANNYIQWKALNTTDPAFIFYLTKDADGYVDVKSYNTDRYWSAPNENKSSQAIQTTTKPDKKQVFNAIGGGQWQIWNTFCTQHYHPESNGGGSGKSGKLVTWNSSGKGSSSTWYVRAINDPNLIDSLDAVKAQNIITAELKTLCNTADIAYNKLFVYNTDLEQPLLTNVTDDDPDDCQISSNASDPAEGLSFHALIDGDPESFWHSTYHATADPGTYHYLQADISNNPQKAFQIYLRRREGTYGNYDRPTAANIYVTNDTTGQWNGTAKWQLAKTVTGLETASEVYECFTPGIELAEPASYIRFEVIEKANAPSRNLNGYPYFNLSEFQIYPVVLNKETSQYYYIAGMKEAADKLLQAVADARALVEANTATQADIDNLQAALDAVDNLYADTTSLRSLITSCTNLASSIEVGTSICQAPEQGIVDNFVNAIETATEAGVFATPLNKEAIDNAYNALKQARHDFLYALNLPKADKWYYISSLDESRNDNPDLYTNGAVIYVKEYGADKSLTWDLNESEELSYNPMAMWHFIPVEDDTYSLTYYVQNLGTGLYIGDYPTYSVGVKTSKTPVLYQLNINGGQPGLIARKGDNPGYSLHAATANKEIVGWSAGGKTASAWDIVEVDDTYVDCITLTTHTNNIDVFAVPYAFADIAENNEDAKTYAIKKMTLDKETDITTIELYEKNEFAAGEPCILVTGDPTIEDSEETTIVIATPTEIAQEMKPANGLVGLLTTEKIPLGAAWFTGKEITNTEASISAHTGYIDATLYQGEVEGVETAMTLTVKGLNWPEGGETGDVNGDGEINSSDVVYIYNAISGEGSGEGADVNGDGAI
ncbi:MAG: dockerin type I repeat-containing protein, partial [Bacteroidaceae bacterium]|nr:dockerin type I repeat-containing protein [Bacteroidaceae bacterium]